VEALAEMEHDCWMVERRIAGWVCGAVREVAREISLYLVPYAELSDDVKEWDRGAVWAISEVYRIGGGATQAGNPCE
jgi:hypothetical protein